MKGLGNAPTAEEPPPPFFIMGCEASGTNLLSTILDTHSRLAVCRGTHYYLLFAPEHRYYGDLGSRTNLTRFVRDVLATARAHRVGAPDPVQLLQVLRESSFEGVLAAFLHLYALERGKVRAGERSAKHYRFIGSVLRGFPRSRVLFTMRNPLDVAAAHKKGFGLDIATAADSWNQAFHAYRANASDRVRLVRYEELVQRPEQTVADICTFLGEAFEPAMLRFYERTPEQYRGLDHHQRLFTPIDSRSVGEYRELAEEEIGRAEALCAVGMRAMGYESTGARRSTVGSEERSSSAVLRKIGGRLRYYGFDRERWSRGLLHWRILLRSRLRYYLGLNRSHRPSARG
jgi:hypothetical protein